MIELKASQTKSGTIRSGIVRRLTRATVREAGKLRQLVITIYPGDIIGLRPLGTRREEKIEMRAVYDRAVINRVNAERALKRAKKK